MSKSPTASQEKKKNRTTRKERREALEKFNMACELCKVIKHFLPDLNVLLSQVKDHRNQSYITYESNLILFVRILSAVFHLGSMRSSMEQLNNSIAIANISKMLNINDLQEIPHGDTINDFLIKLGSCELERITAEIARRLIHCKAFNDSRIRDKYWQILVDGTGLFSFNKKHCDQCLFREHKDKDGNVLYTEYYHYVLEAKLVFFGNIVISIATEFVENDEEQSIAAKEGEKAKQDCEIKAFYRLAKKTKTFLSETAYLINNG